MCRMIQSESLEMQLFIIEPSLLPSTSLSPFLLTLSAVTCPALMAPANGQVSHESLEHNSLATYTCNEGHTLMGAVSRVCSLDGSWSGQEPSCDREFCKNALLISTACLLLIYIEF